MQTTQQDQQRTGQEHEEHQQRQVVIRGDVLRTLGAPVGLYKVQVRRLWDDHYRVNILVGVDAVSAKVAHSYFLVADSDGKIITSTPLIERQY